ncbi:3-oxoacyl-ACP synthase [Tabrizicola sp.]|uniref:3-oxoacyl-ACP synthase n=1 Tax=Tabrizicola sp. TaxID=2005166 RepID=UPI001A5C5F50|nr:3-oxoacyl-ACP synthase [Tabrizicola sp.]MBL9072905.1 3-oxoacyl-ACP synthase [Tabrizicola sp.]
MAETGIAPGLSVIGYGIWSALGPDGPSTIAGVRGQIIGSETGPFWDPTAGAHLNHFRVAAHQWWEGPTFLPDLATPPIEECLAQVATLPDTLRRPASDIPILMTVAPPDRPGRPGDLETRMLDGLARKLGRPLPAGSGVIGGGRSGLPHLLATAARQSARYPLQILIGVESLLRQVIAEHYIARGRLLCGANSSGFTLGEAASAILVARTGTSQRPELAITGMGTGMEPGRDGGNREQAVTGEGLTQAIRAALAVTGIPFYDFPALIGDLNGEHFKFKEQMMAQMRLDRAPPEGHSRRPRGYLEHWNLIEYAGEIGAALMPAQLAWAFEMGRAGLLPQNRALCFAGEDDGRRVALTAEMRGAGP